MSVVIEAGQRWVRKREERTVRVDKVGQTQNGFVDVVDEATGRRSSLRKSTLVRGYALAVGPLRLEGEGPLEV